jgi:hypothetical protein
LVKAAIKPAIPNHADKNVDLYIPHDHEKSPCRLPFAGDGTGAFPVATKDVAVLIR